MCKAQQDFMMKKKVLSLVIAMVFGILTIIISGCATYRIDLVDTGVLSLEQHNTGKVYIAWSGAYEQVDGFVISGVLRRRDRLGAAIRTHVDVTVLSPDGTILDEAHSSDIYVARRITGRSYLSFERFKVCLAEIPAKESLVRLVSHSGRHN
ncbi:MAG: hypothetical protein RQ760_05455 [Sedimentisphaerales bacterium]|nr:hypothetical protein [Sedimentisphaerales bacterium]